MRFNPSTVVFTVVFILCTTEQQCRGAQEGGTNEFPVVWTSYGPVRGQKFISPWTNKAIYSFKGIPYASPPVGKLRFQDPIPPKKWSHIRDATREQAICPQVLRTNDSQSEDCLYVNVYTPQIPPILGELLPVIVFFHGGFLRLGSGNYDNNGPDFLVAEGVVFVSLNYRLGALGFLNLGIPGASGNAGLKDQRLALLWVQLEIQYFGGDPHQVTFFGQSAGAMSAHYHYVSPLSVGLFHKVIGDSGTAISYHDGVRADGALYGLMLSQHLNCGTEAMWRKYHSQALLPGTQVPHLDEEVVVRTLRCLMAVSYQDIIRAQALVKDPQGDLTGLEVFGPTIDRHSSKEPFLPDFPFKLLEQKNKMSIPFIMGINSDEGISRLSRSEEEVRNITNNLEYVYGLEVPQSCFGKLKAKKLKHFYFKYTEPSELNVKGFVDIYTDILYGYGTVVTARNYQSKTDVFLYYFSFNGKFKSPDFLDAYRKYHYSGVTHREDLNYLFVMKDVNQRVPYNCNEIKTLQRMVKMWTNFAKYGTPTVGPDPLLQNVQWQPASRGRTNHLHIDVNLRMTPEDLLAPRAALWDSITFNHCS